MATLADRMTELLARLEADDVAPSAFEAKHKISNGVMKKLASGQKPDVAGRTLLAIATAFGVSLDWLMGGEATPAPGPVTKLDDRYASREEAIALLTGVAPSAVLQSVRKHDLQAASDPGIDYWIDLIKQRAKRRVEAMGEVPIDPSETAPKKPRGTK